MSESAATTEDRCPSCGGDAGDNWFDRSICPAPCLSMHTRCVKCGQALDGCPLEDGSDVCARTSGKSEVGPSGNDGRASDPTAARICECGHKSFNHYHENAPIVEYAQPSVGPCHASVYTTLQMGVNVTRCGCRKFKEAVSRV